MKLQLKRSDVLSGGKALAPTAAAMEFGELAVNYNSQDPALFIKDNTGAIIKLDLRVTGDVPSGSTPPPSGNEVGDLFYDTLDNALKYWNGSAWVTITTEGDAGSGYVKLAGDATTQTITGSGGLAVDGPLHSHQDVSVGGALNTTGDTTVGGALETSSHVTVGGQLKSGKDSNILNVASNLNLGSYTISNCASFNKFKLSSNNIIHDGDVDVAIEFQSNNGLYNFKKPDGTVGVSIDANSGDAQVGSLQTTGDITIGGSLTSGLEANIINIQSNLDLKGNSLTSCSGFNLFTLSGNTISHVGASSVAMILQSKNGRYQFKKTDGTVGYSIDAETGAAGLITAEDASNPDNIDSEGTYIGPVQDRVAQLQEQVASLLARIDALEAASSGG